jgi:hypothetical protein
VLLVAVLLLSGGAYVTHGLLRRRRRRMLAALAREWSMHYSPRDVFELASRLASQLPAVGAADVRVLDLIYGSEDAGHRYIFSAEYTSGITRSRSRRQCVVSVLEPRGHTESAAWKSLRFAPRDLPLIEQYRSVGNKVMNDHVTQRD